MNKYIDNIVVTNLVTSMDLTFSPASLDLVGSPAVGTCGPLVTPNLYTPPGVALTVCDTVPCLTTYSVTLNSVTGTLCRRDQRSLRVHQEQRPHPVCGEEGRGSRPDVGITGTGRRPAHWLR